MKGVFIGRRASPFGMAIPIKRAGFYLSEPVWSPFSKMKITD